MGSGVDKLIFLDLEFYLYVSGGKFLGLQFATL
jgi:hypothetical protein